MRINPILLADCRAAISDSKRARSLDSLLSIPDGQLTKRKYNPVVSAFVEAITEVEEPGSSAADCQRQLRRQTCIESLYSARHLKYVSEFHVSLQAVVYAICGSKAVIDIIGHLGPGCGYTLMKDWLRDMASNKVAVPPGFVSIGFDNEQRLLKNWLARGANRSSVEVLTNLVCAVHDKAKDVQSKGSLHRRCWRVPADGELLSVFQSILGPLQSEQIKLFLDEYLKGRINGLLAAGVHDNVARLVETAERERLYLQCPSCGTYVERRLRNCPNDACSVGNVRAALAEERGVDLVSTEHSRVSRQPTVRAGTRFVYTVEQGECGPVIRRSMSSCSTSESSASSQKVSPAVLVPIEPYFVNPNSHEALRRLLRHIGSECGIKGIGGSDREWVIVVYDGLPYNLMRTVMLDSRQNCQRTALMDAGIPNIASLRKPQLKAECSRRGLSQQGNKADLRQRLQAFVEHQLQQRSLSPLPPQVGEFDWVVCQSGGLHWEMKLAQCLVDVLWSFLYEAFCKSQGYTTPRQLAWAKSCKDHHRTMDELSRFTDGIYDELLRPYVLSAENPSPCGYFAWSEQYSENKTYSWLLHLALQYCFPLFMFRRGMRDNNMALLLEARRLLTPMIHARNHPGYQVIEMFEESDRLSWPEELRHLMDSSAFLSK